MLNYNVLLCREQQLNHWFEMSPKENITNGQNWIRLELSGMWHGTDKVYTNFNLPDRDCANRYTAILRSICKNGGL